MVIQKDQAIEVKENQTVIIFSKECEESIILLASRSKTFGFATFVISLSDVDKIKGICRKSGFGGEYIIASADDLEDVYFYSAVAEGTTAVCAEKITEDGKLSLKLALAMMNVNKKHHDKEAEKEKVEIDLSL